MATRTTKITTLLDDFVVAEKRTKSTKISI